MRIDGARLTGAIHAVDGTKSIERASAHDQAAHQTGADEQVRVESHDSLRQREIFLALPDQLVGDHDVASINRKAAERNVRAIGD